MPSIPTNKKSIWVYIKLDGEDFANPIEFDLRYMLEEEVSEKGIGELEGAGSGGGWMDFSFGVENIVAACRALGELTPLIAKHNVPNELVRFQIVHIDDEICDNLPEYRLGDCLSYRFEDGDYGAAIVLGTSQDKDELAINNNQSGMPPSSGDSVETHLAILDYKSPQLPTLSIFEQKNWLLGTHQSWKGQPYNVWLHCFGGLDIQVLYQITIETHEIIDCSFHLSWEMLPEYVIREKYRDNKALNPYELARDAKEANRPSFIAGDCLSYRFEDGDYGAAIVLADSIDDFSRDAKLLGILDYKQAIPPTHSIFESRNWLLHKNQWANGQPFLAWAHYCWALDCKGIGAEIVERISLNQNDFMTTQLCLYWEGIPEFVLFEMKQP